MSNEYIELHARSAYSFQRGGSQPEILAETAAEEGLEVMAVCDRDGVYGAPKFHSAAREWGIRPIVGCELTMDDESVLPVLVETRTGYRNLCRLITRAKIRAPKGESRILWSELRFYSDGLVALTGDEKGPLWRARDRDGHKGLKSILEDLLEIFSRGNVYIELQRHRVRGENLQLRILRDLAQAFQLPLLATNGVGYATPSIRPVVDAFTCLRHKTHLDEAGRLLSINGERHIKGPRVMQKLFGDMPEAVDNTWRLGERLEFTLEDLGYAFPRFSTPAGETMDSFLWKITFFGAEQRYGGLTPEVRAQLERELKLITRLGFSGYFLIVWDLVNFCRQEHIMVQGRGSAANSAVCYSLGITAVDPVGGKLLFERFLSEGRKTWPDIDLDLPSGDRREQVIQEVYRRYGKHGAAMTANVITYRGRSACREIGKVLNFSEEMTNRFSQLYTHGDFPHTLELERQLKKAGFQPEHPRTVALIRLYHLILRLPRHLGQHSGGMIICQDELDSVVPLENATMPGRVVAQWDKGDCEDMGIIKVDLLGLGMMAALQDTLELTRRRGRPVDLAHIPKDDGPTFKLIRAADTVGVFQIESRAQIATLPRMKPKTFYDLVIEVAIIRPGPIQGNMVHPYLDRRAGRAPVEYIDDRLQPILERTLGVPLFQEQMLKIAMVMADFSGAEAEELRRALSFHGSKERMNRVQIKLKKALQERGHPPKVVEEIVSAISSFALYGFPESHAISFALLAYGSAYLKAHRPVEFFTALLNNQPMGFYVPATLIQDARRHGLRFFPVSVQVSEWDCTVVNDTCIRLGMRMAKGIGKENALAMIEERNGTGFASLADFQLRSGFNRDERRALASVGALNDLAGNRRSALWGIEEELRADDFFDLQLHEEDARGPGPLQLMNRMERLRADYRGLGLTTGSHPMKFCRPHLPDVWRASDLDQGTNGKLVKVAGAVICRQRPATAKGFVFISLEDETGISNVIVTPKFFEQYRLTIVKESFLTITGVLQSQEGVIHIKAEKIEPMARRGLSTGDSHDFH